MKPQHGRCLSKSWIMRRPRPRVPSALDPYLDYLQQRWNEGEHNAKLLHQELKARASSATTSGSRWRSRRCGTVCLSTSLYRSKSGFRGLTCGSVRCRSLLRRPPVFGQGGVVRGRGCLDHLVAATHCLATDIARSAGRGVQLPTNTSSPWSWVQRSAIVRSRISPRYSASAVACVSSSSTSATSCCIWPAPRRVSPCGSIRPSSRNAGFLRDSNRSKSPAHQRTLRRDRVDVVSACWPDGVRPGCPSVNDPGRQAGHPRLPPSVRARWSRLVTRVYHSGVPHAILPKRNLETGLASPRETRPRGVAGPGPLAL
jgi:hypothetical protein